MFKPLVVHSGNTLEHAHAIMVGHTFDDLPVVRSDTPDTLAGFLTRSDILKNARRVTWPRSGNKEDVRT